MLDITHPAIIEYLREIIPGHDPVIKEMENEAERDFVPILQPESIRFIEWLVHLKRPKRILEVGTAIGYSALCMVGASDTITRLDTIELSDVMADRAQQNISAAEKEGIITIHRGDAAVVMPVLIESQVEKYDLIFIDAAKGQYQIFFDAALELLSKDGIILCDNVLLHGMVTAPKAVHKRKRTMVRKLDIFNRETLAMKGYRTSILPVGDGLLLVSPE